MGAADALWDMLDGIFACVVHDGRTGEFCAARDALGVCPLYWGRSADGGTWFCSELKGLQAQCEHFDIFPPVRPAALRSRRGAVRVGVLLSDWSMLPRTAHVVRSSGALQALSAALRV